MNYCIHELRVIKDMFGNHDIREVPLSTKRQEVLKDFFFEKRSSRSFKDDCIITLNTLVDLEILKNKLFSNFNIKRIRFENDTILIDFPKYLSIIDEILMNEGKELPQYTKEYDSSGDGSFGGMII